MTLHTQGLQTLAQARAFVSGNEPISFALADSHTAYDWMADTLKQFDYARCKRPDKGILRRYLRKVTGFSRAQVARCIKQFTAGGGRIKDRRHPPAVPFVRRYTVEDIRLLAEMDALHDTLSGTTTRKLCERAFRVHNDARFERLAGISNGHLYNLRRHKAYQAKRGSDPAPKSCMGARNTPMPLVLPRCFHAPQILSHVCEKYIDRSAYIFRYMVFGEVCC